MYPTLEVRWFVSGQIPEPIHQWFHNGTIAPTPVAEREDWYLCLPGTVNLGIKQREGKLEIKKRTSDCGVCSLSDRVSGQVEQWVKWSFGLDAEQSDIGKAAFQGEWIAVQKSRQQKRYEVTPSGTVQAIDSSDSSISTGCNLELAQLLVFDQPWFSVGFEAFGEMDALEKTLDRVLHKVLADPEFPTVEAEQSMSYPRWLTMLLSSRS